MHCQAYNGSIHTSRQCSLTRVTARDTTLALLDIINNLETNHLQEDVHGIYASPMPLKTWDLSSRGLRELRSPRDNFSKDARVTKHRQEQSMLVIKRLCFLKLDGMVMKSQTKQELLWFSIAPPRPWPSGEVGQPHFLC